MFKKKFVAAIACFAFIGAANAGGGMGGALESTQLLNKAQLVSQVSEAMATTNKLAQQYITQLQQFDIQKLMQKQIEGIIPASALQASLAEIAKIKQARDALVGLRGSLSKLEGNMNTRFQEASLGGISWENYVQNEGERLRQQNQRAILRMKEEKAVMDEVAEDHRLVQQYASRISGTAGVNQSVSLLNTQMNRLIQAQSRISEMMAKSVGTDVAVKEAREAEREKNDMTRLNQWAQRNKIEREQLKGAFDDFKPNIE